MANAGMLMPCRITDISWGGSRIELFTKHKIVQGSTIELHIEIPGLNRRLLASFRCMWIHPVDRSGNKEGNIIGGCFIDMIPEDRNLLLDHAKKQLQHEQSSQSEPLKQAVHSHH